MNQPIWSLETLFQNAKEIKIPSYQRAYAWEEKQLNQFVSDMLEVANKNGGQYYFGHFILEETKENEFELIDGQQRITTFVLFLMVCKLFSENEYNNYIEKFKTVDYDQSILEKIQKKLVIADTKFYLQGDNTLSINRIVFALDYFKKLFVEKKLDVNKIERYVETLIKAHISTHITTEKAVAVQIFELQNTRGIKLSLIEMVKAILMKAVYLRSESVETEHKINIVRAEFAKIYQLEERAISNSFRGNLLLEDILLHHLRIVDDGSKVIHKNGDNEGKFNSPSKSDNKEDAILNYIKSQITSKQPNEVVDYIINLSEKFRMSVELVSKTLPEYDKENRLIGDVLILDKVLSLEFFLLLFHFEQTSFIQDVKFMKGWEKFLFTRDFHDRYHGLQYKDNFERLFFIISKSAIESKSIEGILDSFIDKGFREDKMDANSLPETVKNFIVRSKDGILNNAFQLWFREKIFYTLYKYEISKHADLIMLRKIIKEGRSLEHILPQEWQWEWIEEKDPNNISQNGEDFNKGIDAIINGLGNLLIITPIENSHLSNNHPADKVYKSCVGGFYSEHNENASKWKNYQEWQNIIAERGGKIYEFLKDFIS